MPAADAYPHIVVDDPCQTPCLALVRGTVYAVVRRGRIAADLRALLLPAAPPLEFVLQFDAPQ